MSLPTENVGSLPRPIKPQEAIAAYDEGRIEHDELISTSRSSTTATTASSRG